MLGSAKIRIYYGGFAIESFVKRINSRVNKIYSKRINKSMYSNKIKKQDLQKHL